MRIVKIPLLGKVVLALVLVGLLPFVVVAYQIRVTNDAIVEQVQVTHLAVVRATADRIGAELGLLRALAAATAAQPDLARPSSEEAARVLSGIVLAEPSVAAAGIYVIDPEGGEPEVVQLANRKEDRASVMRALALGNDEELVATSLPDGFWVRTRRPLADGRLVLFMVVNLKALDELLRPSELSEQADLVLATRSGAVLGGYVPSLDVFPPELLERARSPYVAQGAHEVEGRDGERIVSAFSSISVNPSWLVLSREPAEVAKVAQGLMRRAAQRSFAVILVLTALLSAWAWRALVRPIRHLVRAQRRLAGMSSELKADASEIEQLQDSFTLLERHLNDREALSRVFLGRFQVIDVLGVGAMGTVFRGYDPRLERPVALKTLKVGSRESAADGLGDRRQLAESLVREAVTLARLKHPNIVTVYDVLHEGENAFIAMELVEGISLEAYLRDVGQLELEQVDVLAGSILRALAAAHALGVVHHDVKPANILLGDDGSIKVTDFGIADLLTSSNRARDVVCGTPGYLPPETLKGHGYNERSDLFAVGVVLYQCLTGRRPFEGKSAQETMVQTLVGELVSPRRLRRDIPMPLESLVLRLLERLPEDRPLNAASCIEELAKTVPEAMAWSPKPFLDRKTQGFHESQPHTALVPTQQFSHL